jgi:amidase
MTEHQQNLSPEFVVRCATSLCLSKDNIDTKDKMETTASGWMFIGLIMPRDAHVVLKLRDSGASLMGHAILSK